MVVASELLALREPQISPKSCRLEVGIIGSDRACLLDTEHRGLGGQDECTTKS